MMPSPPIHDRSDIRHPCRFLVGSAHARVGPPDRPAIAPPLLSRNVRSARSPLHPHQSSEAMRLRRPPRSNLLNLYAAAKSP
jgi:hypothetical protein